MDEQPLGRPSLVPGERGETDPRVAAVLEVLAGGSVPAVAQRWATDPALLRRWTNAFVAAGSAQVTNTPQPGAAQQRDRFLAAFAHELRTPLTVAQGWLAVLAEGELPPAVAQRTIARLQESLDRLAERVVDVELLAAASLGRVRLERRPTSVADLVAQVPDLAGVELTGGGLAPSVDPGHFRRVLRDLALAARSRPEPRRLTVQASAQGPWIEVRVLREADPVDTDVLRALFEPFELNDDGTGVTIGLYLARALVIAHGGTLGVDQDDDSAAFWVRVPRAPVTATT